MTRLQSRGVVMLMPERIDTPFVMYKTPFIRQGAIRILLGHTSKRFREHTMQLLSLFSRAQ